MKVVSVRILVDDWLARQKADELVGLTANGDYLYHFGPFIEEPTDDDLIIAGASVLIVRDDDEDDGVPE